MAPQQCELVWWHRKMDSRPHQTLLSNLFDVVGVHFSGSWRWWHYFEVMWFELTNNGKH